ncbi:hypothetical protein [Couchioplanes caeruleus]|uniref:hypothetical protein n=1 Tax=Couchioplanes caeruleus TaxID=56438 RepID=UPI0031F9CDA4
MPSDERTTIQLGDPRALQAYAHPLRLSLIGLLRRNGPITATWRATTGSTSWTDDSDDPEARAAADQLNAAILRPYVRRAEACLAVRGNET